MTVASIYTSDASGVLMAKVEWFGDQEQAPHHYTFPVTSLAWQG
jgi:hypothetical protein